MAKIMLVLSREEVQQDIAYPLICETMCGAAWQTGRRRKRWAAEFTESERDACSKLKTLAYKWYLTTGVPDEVTMSMKTFDLWKKLEAFCASI